MTDASEGENDSAWDKLRRRKVVQWGIAYAAGACDLNAYNMRYQVTPEYPEATLAYVMAFDGELGPTFPYIIGLTYYGVPAENDAGGNGGPPPG